MTDKEILESVYEKLATRAEMPSTQDAGSIRSFIEEEWQKRDEKNLSESDQVLYSEEADRLKGKLDEGLHSDLPRAD
jgi:hypothetical protein